MGSTSGQWLTKFQRLRIQLAGGRSHSASVARAYLKLHKAQAELAVSLRQGGLPDRHSDSSGTKPRNYKMDLGRIPAAQTLEAVPYAALDNSPPTALSIPQADVKEAVYGPERPSWCVWLQASQDICCKWGLWAICALVTVCLPKLVTQLIGLCFKIRVTQSVLAGTMVASQAVEEIGGPGQYIVTALEEALDLLQAISSTGAAAGAVSSVTAQAVMHATQSLFREMAGSGNSNSSLLASAILTRLPPAAAAPQVDGWRMPGWLFVLAGSVVTKYLGS